MKNHKERRSSILRPGRSPEAGEKTADISSRQRKRVSFAPDPDLVKLRVFQESKQKIFLKISNGLPLEGNDNIINTETNEMNGLLTGQIMGSSDLYKMFTTEEIGDTSFKINASTDFNNPVDLAERFLTHGNKKLRRSQIGSIMLDNSLASQAQLIEESPLTPRRSQRLRLLSQKSSNNPSPCNTQLGLFSEPSMNENVCVGNESNAVVDEKKHVFMESNVTLCGAEDDHHQHDKSVVFSHEFENSRSNAKDVHKYDTGKVEVAGQQQQPASIISTTTTKPIVSHISSAVTPMMTNDIAAFNSIDMDISECSITNEVKEEKPIHPIVQSHLPRLEPVLPQPFTVAAAEPFDEQLHQQIKEEQQLNIQSNLTHDDKHQSQQQSEMLQQSMELVSKKHDESHQHGYETFSHEKVEPIQTECLLSNSILHEILGGPNSIITPKLNLENELITSCNMDICNETGCNYDKVTATLESNNHVTAVTESSNHPDIKSVLMETSHCTGLENSEFNDPDYSQSIVELAKEHQEKILNLSQDLRVILNMSLNECLDITAQSCCFNARTSESFQELLPNGKVRVSIAGETISIDKADNPKIYQKNQRERILKLLQEAKHLMKTSEAKLRDYINVSSIEQSKKESEFVEAMSNFDISMNCISSKLAELENFYSSQKSAFQEHLYRAKEKVQCLEKVMNQSLCQDSNEISFWNEVDVLQRVHRIGFIRLSPIQYRITIFNGLISIMFCCHDTQQPISNVQLLVQHYKGSDDSFACCCESIFANESLFTFIQSCTSLKSLGNIVFKLRSAVETLHQFYTEILTTSKIIPVFDFSHDTRSVGFNTFIRPFAHVIVWITPMVNVDSMLSFTCSKVECIKGTDISVALKADVDSYLSSTHLCVVKFLDYLKHTATRIHDEHVDVSEV